MLGEGSPRFQTPGYGSVAYDAGSDNGDNGLSCAY